jgi:hypothetical protein
VSISIVPSFTSNILPSKANTVPVELLIESRSSSVTVIVVLVYIADTELGLEREGKLLAVIPNNNLVIDSSKL